MEKSKTYSVKNEIMEACMRLMAKKLYMDITVTDIINEAGVARASFYRNFDSISDVIDAAADIFYDDVHSVLSSLSETDERKWREFLFNHFYQILRRQNEMGRIRNENMPVLFSRIDSKIELDESLNPPKTIKGKYNAAGKMGLINSVTRKWMETGAKESPEEMINYIMTFITSF